MFGGMNVALNIVQGETFDRVAFSEPPEIRDATAAVFPMPLNDQSLAGRAMLAGEVVHIGDVLAEPWIGERSRSIFRRTGARSALCAPIFFVIRCTA